MSTWRTAKTVYFIGQLFSSVEIGEGVSERKSWVHVVLYAKATREKRAFCARKNSAAELRAKVIHRLPKDNSYKPHMSSGELSLKR